MARGAGDGDVVWTREGARVAAGGIGGGRSGGRRSLTADAGGAAAWHVEGLGGRARAAEARPVARDDAELILRNDPELESERGQALRQLLYLFERDAAIRYLRSG